MYPHDIVELKTKVQEVFAEVTLSYAEKISGFDFDFGNRKHRSPDWLFIYRGPSINTYRVIPCQVDQF